MTPFQRGTRLSKSWRRVESASFFLVKSDVVDDALIVRLVFWVVAGLILESD